MLRLGCRNRDETRGGTYARRSPPSPFWAAYRAESRSIWISVSFEVPNTCEASNSSFEDFFFFRARGSIWSWSITDRLDGSSNQASPLSIRTKNKGGRVKSRIRILRALKRGSSQHL